MTTTIAEIHLEGAGSGVLIEALIQWDYVPGFRGDRIDPPYSETAESIGITGWRHLDEREWRKPDPAFATLLASFVDPEWLIEQGDHIEDYGMAAE